MSETLLRWPEWMPNPSRTGYGYEPQDRRLSSEMEIGTVNRVEFDTDETIIQCGLMLNGIQSRFFEAFERDCLRQGSRWFEMPVQIAGEVGLHTVQFKSRPKAAEVIGLHHTRYTFSLRIEKRDLPDGELMSLLLLYSPEELLRMSGRLHAVLHVEMPGVANIGDEVWQ